MIRPNIDKFRHAFQADGVVLVKDCLSSADLRLCRMIYNRARTTGIPTVYWRSSTHVE